MKRLFVSLFVSIVSSTVAQAEECKDQISFPNRYNSNGANNLYAVSRTPAGGCKVALLKLGQCRASIGFDHGWTSFGCPGGFSGNWTTGGHDSYKTWRKELGPETFAGLKKFDERDWNGPLITEGTKLTYPIDDKEFREHYPARTPVTRKVGMIVGDGIQGAVSTSRYRTRGGKDRAFVAAQMVVGTCLKLSAYAWTDPTMAEGVEQSLLSGLQGATMVPASDDAASSICQDEIRIERLHQDE